MVSRYAHPAINIERALFRELYTILRSYKYRATSSKDVQTKIKEANLKKPTHIFHKYDVRQLYPSIDMLFAIGVVRKYIQDLNLYNNTETAQVCELLKIIMHSHYFEFEGDLYEQSKGVPIGGTISGLLAEAVLQFIEDQALLSQRIGLKLFLRYADDLLIAWEQPTPSDDPVVQATNNQASAENLMEFLSNVRPEITYVREEEPGYTTNFLDLTITLTTRDPTFNINRKPTYTWHFPPWKGRASKAHKKSSVLPHFIRAHTLLKGEQSKPSELKLIFTKAVSEGYPIRLLLKWNKNAEYLANKAPDAPRIARCYRSIRPTPKDPEIKKILAPHNVIPVYRKCNTLLQRLRLNTRSETLHTPGVYEVHLQRTNGTQTENAYYIGRTLNAVTNRISQHKTNIRLLDCATSLASASLHEGWTPIWDDTRILERPRTILRSVLAEYLHIALAPDPLVNTREDSPRLDIWRNAV